ncbi:hypothetical protein HDU96_008531 [Phlyctochytrium bullatum]|nr:hypothetical protein HDU96_008531 [Phlyctochytrium bullatum]
MGRTIEIPIKNSEEVIVVDVDEVANNEHESATIINILSGEAAPLRLYLEFAVLTKSFGDNV